jgi:acyl carrier protein phosphodiesterase
VNFFGHLVVARRTTVDPDFLLGAMLPDLAHLCGAFPRHLPAAVAAGVEHHHRADAVFHSNPTFRELVAASVRHLEASAVSRGGARGAAHVSVELLLDGLLAGRDEAGRQAFTRSLRPLDFDDAASARRWIRMCERLAEAGVPLAYADPDFVCDRVVGALSRRPRLALALGDQGVLRAHLPDLRARVSLAADALVAP